MNATYLGLEMKRIVRNLRFFLFTVGFPVVFFLLFSSLYARGKDAAVIKEVMMIGMAAYAGLTASMSTSSRIAVERGAGWQRQLRLTRLSGGGYLMTKALTAMLIAIVPMSLVYLVGVVDGVRMDAGQWLLMVPLTWLALLPSAILGVVLGQFTTSDSVQAVTSAAFMVLSLAGGLWMPPQVMPGWMVNTAHLLPSFWLGEIGRQVADHSAAISARGAITLAAWVVALALIAAMRYTRDSART
jgi:ABC-2 type transport system permease protein